MTLEDLRSFVAAHRAGSLSGAARQLRCTQGAVAQHVRKLERELGVELFSRAPRGVVPTEEGHVLFEAACRALERLDAGIAELERRRNPRQARVSITLSAMAASDVLRQPILALKKRCPELVIEIRPENTAEGRLRALREGRADLALLPQPESMHGLEFRPVMQLQLVLLVHVGHRFAMRKRLAPHELGSIHYIAQSTCSATYCHLDRWLRSVGVQLQPSEIVEDPTTAVLMVELGRGETFVPTNQARVVERGGRARGIPVRALPPIPVGWAARSFAALPHAASALLEEFRDHASRVERWTGTPPAPADA